jgi:hypothetical protein
VPLAWPLKVLNSLVHHDNFSGQFAPLEQHRRGRPVFFVFLLHLKSALMYSARHSSEVNLLHACRMRATRAVLMAMCSYFASSVLKVATVATWMYGVRHSSDVVGYDTVFWGYWRHSGHTSRSCPAELQICSAVSGLYLNAIVPKRGGLRPPGRTLDAESTPLGLTGLSAC